MWSTKRGARDRRHSSAPGGRADEDTSRHYAPEAYPAAADYTLLSLLVKALEKEGVKPHVGLVITTSSTFTESLEWARKWSRMGVLCVECEVSVLYTLARLTGIPAAAVLVVSDSIPGRKVAFRTRTVYHTYMTALRAALEAVKKHSETTPKEKAHSHDNP